MTDLIRRSARASIAAAVEQELSEFMSNFQDLQMEDGKAQLVRNGYREPSQASDNQ